MSDLEERLKKETELRQRLEKQIRQYEVELNENREQLSERTQQVNELQAQLQKRETELTTAFARSEEEANQRRAFSVN